MGDLEKIGSAKAIREIVVMAHTAAEITLHYHLRMLKHQQMNDLLQKAKSYILDNGKAKTICFKLCGIDLISKEPVFAFTDPVDSDVEVVRITQLPFETKLFLIELIEKL